MILHGPQITVEVSKDTVDTYRFPLQIPPGVNFEAKCFPFHRSLKADHHLWRTLHDPTDVPDPLSLAPSVRFVAAPIGTVLGAED